MEDQINNNRNINKFLKKKLSQIAQRFNYGRLLDVLSHLIKTDPTYFYSEIQAYNYFDPSWYMLAYKSDIQYPDDLLMDYIRAGIPNGRDPSPYFNTVLYLRENHVPPEKALLHFLRSGRAIASGAYRNEQALLQAQQSFRDQTATVLVADRHSDPKPFAVYLQCGSDSVWGDWQPAQGRSWDLLINHYDSTYLGKIPCEVEFSQAGTLPGTKFTSFSELLNKLTQLLEPYHYVLLLDDDVVFQNGDIDRLFSIIQNQGWELAQPSLSSDSFCSYPVFGNPGKSGWRQVNGVEIMMPVFSTRILGSIQQLIGESISGWGFDAALSILAARLGFRAIVVDDIVAQHSVAINADTGPYYQMLHQAQIYPEIELTHLQKKYGYTKPYFYEIS